MNEETLEYIKYRASESETASIKAVSCHDIRELLAERDHLKAVNAELLEALNRIAEMGETGSMPYTLAEIARAAILNAV